MWRWHRSDREGELDRELRDHLDLEAEDRLAAGSSSDAARDAARRTFGSTALIKEDVREAWGRTWIDRFAQDLRFGLRLLINAPAFSAIAATIRLAASTLASPVREAGYSAARTVGGETPHTAQVLTSSTVRQTTTSARSARKIIASAACGRATSGWRPFTPSRASSVSAAQN
jgi:hypothetical protein